MKLYAENIQS